MTNKRKSKHIQKHWFYGVKQSKKIYKKTYDKQWYEKKRKPFHSKVNGKNSKENEKST